MGFDFLKFQEFKPHLRVLLAFLCFCIIYSGYLCSCYVHLYTMFRNVFYNRSLREESVDMPGEKHSQAPHIDLRICTKARCQRLFTTQLLTLTIRPLLPFISL